VTGDYQEHDKLQKVQADAQAAGDFVTWLATQGIHLMMWREDLTDLRVTDPECTVRREELQPCDQTHRRAGDAGLAPWLRHCLHWQDPEREVADPAKAGFCCRCGKGQFSEIHGVKAWTGPGKNLVELLAEWTDIDQGKIEAEKRKMLERVREMNVQEAER
jgi:hypothetical protein